MLKYGIIKERVAALLTDALRANLLEQQGYETQILEFIDMEHHPEESVDPGSEKERYAPEEKRRYRYCGGTAPCGTDTGKIAE